MADFGALDTFTLEAAADLSALQYHVVKGVAANTCNVSSDATNSDMLGVLLNKPISGGFATVADGGICKVVAGAAINAYDVLTSNSSGRAAVVTSGQVAFGRALSATGADGDLVTVRLMRPIRWAGAP